MKLYSIKTLLLHFAIATTYVATTSYFFVIAKDPDPIGTGLRQWMCIFLHFNVTLYILLTFLGKATNRKEARKKLWLHLAAVVLIVSLLLLFSNPLWEWLWSQR